MGNSQIECDVNYWSLSDNFMKEVLKENFTEKFREYALKHKLNKNEIQLLSLNCGKIFEEKCFLADIGKDNI